MINRITNAWKNLNELSPTILGYIRNFIFLFILLDLFGIVWYLKQKKLGIALFLVAGVFLGMILLIERRQNNRLTEEILGGGLESEKMEECDECHRKFRTQNELAQHIMAKHFKKNQKTKEEPEKSKEEPKEEPDLTDDLGFGFPDPEEYQRRIEKGLGGGFEI